MTDPADQAPIAPRGDQDTPTSSTPAHPSAIRDVEYKGAPLDADRGPGLGCFYVQLSVLAIAVVLTPLTVVWGWPAEVSAALLFLVVLLLLLTGQTIIFLLRLVAADRRASGRRRPLASATKTVGELEDERRTDVPGSTGEVDAADEDPPAGS